MTVQIFIPNIILKEDVLYLRGVYNEETNTRNVVINFIAFHKNLKVLQRAESHEPYIYGYYNSKPSKKVLERHKCLNFLEFNPKLDEGLKAFMLEGINIDVSSLNCIITYYDLSTMQYAENLSLFSNKDTISLLHKKIKEEQSNYVENSIVFEPVFKKPNWLTSTMFGQHFLNYIDVIKWLYSSIKRDKKVSIKQGNMLLSIVIDFIFGYLILNFFTQHKDYLSNSIMEALDMLVKYLFTLLEWVMGAPAGLKLNNAFNKMLGQFFSYHIKLWWIFIEVSGENLERILDIFHCLGYLGFTFQAAMVSDLICVATFHSYCIYVYVARLFNIQISGLIALMRLFVGRKYNPLRNSIDSCEYTNQELFVGTVAFTILLFLLPTTTMYYVVFALLRLLSLSIQYILSKLIYWIQTLPLYVIFLWIIKSPKVAGKVSVVTQSKVMKNLLTLQLRVDTKSLGALLSHSQPPVVAQSPVEWSSLLSNLLRGKQIT